MSRYAAKVDANHGQIRDCLRGMGAYVVDCSKVGAGFPDLLVGWRGRWMLVEVKDGAKVPSARCLTVQQRVLQADAERVGCVVHVVKNEAEALALLGARLSA